jgi:hypothetical protein
MIQIIIVFLLVLSIWYTMQPGEIFGKLGLWLGVKLPANLHPPVFECNVCMTPWYGSVIYWLLFHNDVADWIVTVIAAMGMQVVLNKLSPKK